MDTSEPKAAHQSQTEKPSRIVVRSKRLSKETWARILDAYMGGATARELALKHGVAVQSIYSRMNGKGKKARWAGIGGRDSGIGDRGADKGARVFRPASLATNAGEPGAGGSILETSVDVVGDTAGGAPAVQENAGLKTRAPLRAPLIEGGASVAAFLANTKGIRVRRHHAAEVWRQMRRDYEEGGFTAPVIANWYGATHHAVKKRALKEGWSKLVRAAAPEPLFAFPKEEEATKCGEAFVSRWREIAHAAQLPPEGAWATWLFQGGRGAGKTRAGAEWLAARAASAPGLFALVGPTQHDVREVMVDGVSGLRNLPGRERPQYERSRRRLLWANGSVAYAFSAEEPERLRGPQFEAAWADEFCIWPRPSETLAILRMGLRLGVAPQLVVTTTPKPIPALRALRAEASCVVTQAATVVNAGHLSPSFLDGLHALYGGTRLAAQELDGLLLEGDGALWKLADLERARGGVAPKCERVVVGVDPPAGSGGSACGIVVAGRVGERFFVLADRSALGLSPLGWANVVSAAAKEFGASEIVAEANQGGDMVRAVLAQAGAPCGVRLVHAAHSKRVRAEPIALLYEQGRVAHCGAFGALEEELLALGAAESEGLLDRADALVWALTALMSGGQGPRVRLLDVGPRPSGLTGRW
jgi:phage terminase large subunit-like protein